MKILIRQVSLLVIFWLLFFFISRIVFYICINSLLSNVPLNLILKSLYKGLRLDFSMIAYFMSIPLLLICLFYLIRKKAVIILIDILNYIFIIIYALTAAGEACLYQEWRSKLNMQALEHFINPSEVFRTASLYLTILFFGLSILYSFIFIKLYNWKISLKKYIPLSHVTILSRVWKGVILLFCITALSVINIRGGLQQIPIQSSDAFFCTEPIANDAAVNPFWHIAYNIMDYQDHFRENPFKDFSQEKSDSITRSLYAIQKDTTIQFLTTKRPNIVFILLESWSASTVKSFGGDDFAPFIDSLSRKGIRFTKLYPAGYTSDQGIPAILSGYPCVSRISVISQSLKSAKLPCINYDLKKYGYKSGFVFGGDLNYGNIRGYVFNKEFDLIKEEKDFGNSLPHGKLGIHDEFIAKEFLTLLKSASEPFIYSWFTVSTHIPYDYPGEKKHLVNLENDYINAITYSDHALRHFFKKAQEQAWYKNTLFIIVADHSHPSHKNLSPYDAEYHRIPLLFFGEVIKNNFKGKCINKVYSQLDIPTTILKQMGLDNESKQYIWSKNMFNPYTKEFAYYSCFDGGGIVTKEGYIGYHHKLNDLLANTIKNKNPKLIDSVLHLGKAFQQSIYEDYRLK